MFFHYETIKRITQAILNTFNNVEVKRYDNFGNYVKSIIVPITWSTKDKAYVLSKQDIEYYKVGNFNFLPRMSLSLLSINPNREAATNRLQKINVSTSDDKIVSYQRNAAPYNLTFNISVAARSIADLFMILEQILPYFNPTMNFKIYEAPFITEATAVPIKLDSVDMDLPENLSQDDDVRIVSANITITASMNLYLPIMEEALIKEVRMYFNHWEGTNPDENLRHIKHEHIIDQNTGLSSSSTRTDLSDNTGLYLPNCSIVGPDNIALNISSTFSANVSDVDSEIFTYVWSVIPNTTSAIVSTGNYNTNILSTLEGNFKLQLVVIDKNGNQSLPAIKTVTVGG